jgi:transcriptional regulator with PAS, ATPase and Fis domain
MLFAWVGNSDLRAPTDNGEGGRGPIFQALNTRVFDEAFLISDFTEAQVTPYLTWLEARSSTPLNLKLEKLSGPSQFGEIYEAAGRIVQRAIIERTRDTELTFHLSPGTPAMAAVWIILAKTRFPAELIESSKDLGVRTVTLPFEISAHFIPDLRRERDEQLKRRSAACPPEFPEFSDIVYRGGAMERVMQRARRVALRNVPVLIEGESGTGKELLARAIHRESPRREQRFVRVNCGAITENLLESELFGHEKGAFAGASASHRGYFEVADHGTVFLDEIGELPLSLQVKLLRVLQEGEVLRVGAARLVKVDVRVIAATNRRLTEAIAKGRFREDLFYRVAVAMLQLPPLRERGGDLGLLIDHALSLVNHEECTDPSYQDKKLCAAARNLLLGHVWPGNVRELLNTLRRAAIWSDGPTISVDDARESLLSVTGSTQRNLLDRPLGDGFDLQDLLNNVAQSYLTRAMSEAKGNKTKAAELIGLPSYQTLTNWLAKYKVQT